MRGGYWVIGGFAALVVAMLAWQLRPSPASPEPEGRGPDPVSSAPASAPRLEPVSSDPVEASAVPATPGPSDPERERFMELSAGRHAKALQSMVTDGLVPQAKTAPVLALLDEELGEMYALSVQIKAGEVELEELGGRLQTIHGAYLRQIGELIGTEQAEMLYVRSSRLKP